MASDTSARGSPMQEARHRSTEYRRWQSKGNCYRTEFIMKTTIPEPSTERLSLRQRIRLFWSTLERYAEAFEQTPYDHLLDRICRLEEDVKRIENSLPSKFVGKWMR